MEFSTRPVRTLALVLVAALLSACAPRDEVPARKAIDQISAAIESAGPDATKYVPGHVAALEGQVTKLKIRFYDKDYKAIVEDAPAILDRAKGLASTAAAKKAEIAKVLDGEWDKIVTDVPASIASAEKYVDGLIASKKTAPGMTQEMVASARTGIDEQKALWEKATAAKAAGDLEQAVTIGAHVKRRLENLVAALGGNTG
jgi:type IV pilus biogenesis protein CpaD/CtpE